MRGFWLSVFFIGAVFFLVRGVVCVEDSALRGALGLTGAIDLGAADASVVAGETGLAIGEMAGAGDLGGTTGSTSPEAVSIGAAAGSTVVPRMSLSVASSALFVIAGLGGSGELLGIGMATAVI
ncbi:MAG: hypothetical protein AAB365_02390 [Patescibacteria group bacterium]